MQIQVKADHLELTDALRTYAEEKVDKLRKYLGDTEPIEAKIKLARTTNHHNKGEVFECQIQLDVPGDLLIIEHVEDDLYKAIDKAQERMEKVIEKYKEKAK